MFAKRHLNRYADVLLWGLMTSRHKKFNKGDIILIRFNLSALKLSEILGHKILKMGMNPVFRMASTPVMEQNFFNLSNNSQLVFKTPGDKELYEHLSGSIFLHAPESITHLSGTDPKKLSKFAISNKYLREILDQREASGLFGWSLCMLPTQALAKHAGLTLEAYTNQIIKACFLNRKDPVKEWKSIYKKAGVLKKWLNSMDVKYFHIESNHIDLSISAGRKRKWLGISGHNIPSFELFISPDWRGVKGVYYADQPSYRSGNYVEQVRLEFKKGAAVKIHAKKGENFVKKQLSMDKGASRIGEFSLTDKRFSKIDKFMANTLFDENYGGKYGNCHIAVGSSYADSYDGDTARLTKKLKAQLGFNNSALHWDLVNTEKKRVTAHMKTGKPVLIYENGMFKY